MSADAPSDEAVERSIKKEKHYLDPKENSIVPEFLENDGIPAREKVSRDEIRKESQENLQDNVEIFEELSSDKEEDTTEGEITDTHTSE